MPDYMDHAQDEAILFNEAALSAFRPQAQVKFHRCRNCDEPLPADHHGSCCSRECRDDLEHREYCIARQKAIGILSNE